MRLPTARRDQCWGAPRAAGRPPRAWRPRASRCRGRSSPPTRASTPSASGATTGPSLRSFWSGARGAAPAQHHPGCNPCSLARAPAGARRAALRDHPQVGRRALQPHAHPAPRVDARGARPRRADGRPLARHVRGGGARAGGVGFVDGTLLEGELVWRQPHERDLLFLVFDAVRVKGEPLAAAPFGERMRRAEAATRFSEEIAAVAAGEGAAQADAAQRALEVDCVALVHYDPPLAMRPKHFVERRHAARLWGDRRECEHRVDGLILMDLDAPYVRGNAEAGAAIPSGRTTRRSTSRAAAAARCAPPTPLPAALLGRRVVVRENRVHEVVGADSIVEYHVHVTDDAVELTPLRTRPDKAAANGLRVVAATVQDVLDAIAVEELAEGAPSE